MSGDTKVKLKKAARGAGITLTLGGTFGLGLLARGAWFLSAIASQVEANEETIREDIKPEIAILRDAVTESRVHYKQIESELKWMKRHWPK